ncbi:MAG: endo alpha-1,4 polygalactosaminidase [Tatlockia sp.]|nr:endo alpha-1,4 polygalactosaminidase [Tatlockia sp.]
MIILLIMLAFLPFSSSYAQLPAPEPCTTCLAPIKVGSKWNIILSPPIRFSIMAEVYDIDGFDNDAEAVAKIHSLNSIAICYISAGAWEKWRPDASDFPESVKGKTNQWPGEKWLDIRQTAQLLPLMQARINLCKTKGFDAVDFDNVDGYSNKTGFPLTKQDQLNYNVLLANMAHQSGLLVGLKNDLAQIKELEPYFDFAVNEQCFQYKECNLLEPFIKANKAVFNIEYKLKSSQFCPLAKEMHFSSIKKSLDLTEPVKFCD